jgi:uncharacterized membrane protein YuzA (DUF378 family)
LDKDLTDPPYWPVRCPDRTGTKEVDRASLRCTRSSSRDRRSLNWGLVALAEFDLVAALTGNEFGETSSLSRIVYGAVGIAASTRRFRLIGAVRTRPAIASAGS